MQLNNDYSLLFYHDGKINMEGIIKEMELKGYMSRTHSEKLLVIAFYWDFMYNDYRALLSKEDYRLIEGALDCIYGTSCLIPYPDYLKMGKLHLGEMTEMAQRVKTLEDTDVVKVMQDLNNVDDTTQSDIYIVSEDSDT